MIDGYGGARAGKVQDVINRSMVEIRWLRAGRLPAAVAGWFDSLPGRCRAGRRIDAYWIGTELGPGADLPCVKLRGVTDQRGRPRQRRLRLEVKVLLQALDEVIAGATVRGRAEVWRKSAARLTPPAGSGDRAGWAPHGAGWVAVAKRRRQRRLPTDQGASVRVEVTRLDTAGQQAWSVALHAPADATPGLRALSAPAIAPIFDQWPAAVALDPTASTSYATWLRESLGPEGPPPGPPPQWLAEAAARLAAACVAAD